MSWDRNMSKEFLTYGMMVWSKMACTAGAFPRMIARVRAFGPGNAPKDKNSRIKAALWKCDMTIFKNMSYA